MSLAKLFLYLVAVIFAVAAFFTFIVPIILIAVVFLVIEVFFTLLRMNRSSAGRSRRNSHTRPEPPPSPAPEPAPDSPASEAVIEVEAVDLPDEPPHEPARLEDGK